MIKKYYLLFWVMFFCLNGNCFTFSTSNTVIANDAIAPFRDTPLLENYLDSENIGTFYRYGTASDTYSDGDYDYIDGKNYYRVFFMCDFTIDIDESDITAYTDVVYLVSVFKQVGVFWQLYASVYENVCTLEPGEGYYENNTLACVFLLSEDLLDSLDNIRFRPMAALIIADNVVSEYYYGSYSNYIIVSQTNTPTSTPTFTPTNTSMSTPTGTWTPTPNYTFTPTVTQSSDYHFDAKTVHYAPEALQYIVSGDSLDCHAIDSRKTTDYPDSDRNISHTFSFRTGVSDIVLSSSVIGFSLKPGQSKDVTTTMSTTGLPGGTYYFYSEVWGPGSYDLYPSDNTAHVTVYVITATPTYTPTYTPTSTSTPTVTPTPTMTNTPLTSSICKIVGTDVYWLVVEE